MVYSATLVLSILLALIVLGLIIWLCLKAQHMPIVSGKEELIGSVGTVQMMSGAEGLPRIRIRGELWQIESSSKLYEGQRVKVIGLEELVLIVTPLDDSLSPNFPGSNQ